LPRPKPTAEPDTRAADRAQVRYRVNREELPLGAEPAWEDLEPWANVEKWVYGAGWLSVPPVRPVMATSMGHPDPVTNRIRLEGPIWPPRNPS
jgi:hypothetical protein